VKNSTFGAPRKSGKKNARFSRARAPAFRTRFRTPFRTPFRTRFRTSRQPSLETRQRLLSGSSAAPASPQPSAALLSRVVGRPLFGPVFGPWRHFLAIQPDSAQPGTFLLRLTISGADHRFSEKHVVFPLPACFPAFHVFEALRRRIALSACF